MIAPDVSGVIVPPAPMLARLERELPLGAYSYEPKWDGFRCIAMVRRGSVGLTSRHGRPLARYFPEVTGALAAIGEAVLDGELVILSGDRPGFTSLLGRLHPAASRVELLSREHPASFMAFDLISVGSEDVTATPFLARRALLEELLRHASAPLLLTPFTRDPAVARRWLEAPPGGGIDGVVAKRDDLQYQPGRRAMVKVKALRTVDCVVAGFRSAPGVCEIASLLLGLHAGRELRHVGVVASFADLRRRELFAELSPRAVALEGHPWQHGFNVEGSPVGRLGGSAGRWDPRTMELDWTPLRPELVCEVSFDQLDGARFRHAAQLVRWRPDRVPSSCSIDQLSPLPASPARELAR